MQAVPLEEQSDAQAPLNERPAERCDRHKAAALAGRASCALAALAAAALLLGAGLGWGAPAAGPWSLRGGRRPPPPPDHDAAAAKAPRFARKFEVVGGVNVTVANDTQDDTVVTWIIQFPPGTTDEALSKWGDIDSLASHVNALLAHHDLGEVKYRGHPDGKGLPLIIYKAPFKTLKLALKYFQNVSFVEQAQSLKPVPEIKSNRSSAVKLKAVGQEEEGRWNLRFLNDPEAPATGKYNNHGLTGEGVHVYVLDTGIHTGHKEFNGRAVPTLEVLDDELTECKAGDVSCAKDNDGHGTHCASIAGGKVSGVAKGATLHAVKVLWEDGGSTSSILMAMDWILAQGERPAVMSMSFGGPTPEGYWGRAMRDAIRHAGRDGIVSVVAAGNEGDTDDPYACDYDPAYVHAALTVGSVGSDMTRSWFSNVGRCVDIFAPGEDIEAAAHSSDTGSVFMDGTSMACPHVSGVAALVLGAAEGGIDARAARRKILGGAVRGKVEDAGRWSPNKLLNVEFLQGLKS